MRWTARVAAAMCCMAVLMVTLGGAASALGGKHPRLAHRAAHAVPGKHVDRTAVAPNTGPPPKYQQVTSALLTAPAGAQTRGTVTCPAKTVPYDGGAVISSTSTLSNLNSSFPTDTGWDVDVNNAGAAADTFRVYAVCAKKNVKWSIVFGTPVTNAATAQNSALATCPAGTRVTGGGGYSSSGSLQVNMNTTIPLKTGTGKKATYSWRTDENNASTTATTITSVAVCGRAAGYKIVAGTTVTMNAQSQGSATVACPSPTVVLGGGGFSSSGSTVVDLNSTLPISTTTWQVYEDNNTTGTNSLTAYAVCAGT